MIARAFNPHRPAARPKPRARPDPTAVRRVWLDLVADAGRVAARLVDSDGEELLEPLDLRHALSTLDAHSFPTPGASAQGAAYAFLLQLRGVLEAGTPRVRAVIAEALAASARALDQLMNDQAVAAAASWKRMLPGEAD